jgi:hypothetical protein
MSPVRETDSRQDALRERLRDPVYAHAYRKYITGLAQRVRATMGAAGRGRTRRAAQTIGSATRAVGH